ncbi:MAG: sigma-70 family RNA polymerase sigma factor [Thermoplasmata archaeon]
MDQPQEMPITAVLRAATAGDRAAADQLLPLVYGELHSLAHARRAHQQPGQTLQTTALVHEAYLKLVGSGDPGWEGRGHFFGAAAQAMRQILVDQARRKARIKHGGDRQRVDLDEISPMIDPPTDDVLELDEALRELEQIDPRKARLVMLRYFAGLTMDETASVLGVSLPTAERDWRYVKVWLYDRLRGSDERVTDR